jgi:hypothetical protein
MMKDLYKRYHADINFAHMGASAFVEDSREMNAGLDIKDAFARPTNELLAHTREARPY